MDKRLIVGLQQEEQTMNLRHVDEPVHTKSINQSINHHGNMPKKERGELDLNLNNLNIKINKNSNGL